MPTEAEQWLNDGLADKVLAEMLEECKRCAVCEKMEAKAAQATLELPGKIALRQKYWKKILTLEHVLMQYMVRDILRESYCRLIVNICV